MSSKSRDYCLGIDFGTSNSCAAIYINSSVIAVPNTIGERTTPSIVSFSDKIYLGEETLDQKIEGKNIISEIKRFIGLDYDEFIKNDFVKNLNYDVVNKDGKPLIKVLFKGKEEYYSPEQISSYIIKKMVQIAEDFIDEKEVGIKIKKAVISVPVNFNECQKEAIEYAAKLAGINTIRTIKEPTAAALAYGLGNGLIKNEEYYKNNFSNVAPSANETFKKEQNVLVFDLGGGTFDLTLLNLSKNDNDLLDFNIISNQGKTHLGGSDFDNKIVDYCIKTFCDITGYDEEDIRKDKRACKKLSIKCEAAKKLLSISNEADINIVDFYNNEYLSVKITIDLFERLCKDLFEEIKKTIMELLGEKKINPEFIEAIILVGGATRMVGIKKLLKSIFEDEQKIKDNIDPDVAVAMGATLQSLKIEQNDKINFVLQDIIPYNLGISVKNPKKDINEIERGDLMYPILKKNSRIPCSSKEETFNLTLTQRHKDIIINIYEGNKKYAKDNKKLDLIKIENFNILGDISYKLRFNVDINSKLTVNVICESLWLNINKEIKQDITNGFIDISKNKIIINKSKSIGPINSIISNINSIKESLSNSQDLEDRMEYLIECSKEYEELIKKYKVFEKFNEYAIEKVYINTKELFNFYLERLTIITNKPNKDKVGEIINKIKEGMKNVISVVGYVSDLLNIFIVSRENYNKIYFFQIFANYMELMNNEGQNRIEKKKYSRYFSKLYFEKVFFTYKKYILNENLASLDRDDEIKKKLEEQKRITEDKLKEINSFAFVIENIVKQNQYLYGKTGFTKIVKKIEKMNNNSDELTNEEMIELYDLFKNMADSYDKRGNNIGEAYCLANIIKISSKILKNNDNDVLMDYICRFRQIMTFRNGKDYKWYKEINEIIEEIDEE